MAQTPEEYYEDEALWGGYQFTTITNLMDRLLLETTDSDSYLVNVPRHKILNTLKNGIRKVNKETRRIVHAIEFTLPKTGYFTLPQDYTDWVRVSVAGLDGKLTTLGINTGISIATGYLQDHDDIILFDDEGQILMADSLNAYAVPYKKRQFCESLRAGYQTLDTSKLSRSGEFNIDEERGTIIFSEDMVDREIVIEYISDGLASENLSEEEIKIHKDLEDVLYEYTYSYCIATRRNVPRNEKDRAKRSYKTELHKVKIDVAGFDMNKINQVARTQSKQF